jgi:hypothetical protein
MTHNDLQGAEKEAAEWWAREKAGLIEADARAEKTLGRDALIAYWEGQIFSCQIIMDRNDEGSLIASDAQARLTYIEAKLEEAKLKPFEQVAPKAPAVEDEVVSVKTIKSDRKTAKEEQAQEQAEKAALGDFLDRVTNIAYKDGDDLKEAIEECAKDYGKPVAQVEGALTLIRKGIAREQLYEARQRRQKEQARSAGDGYVLLEHSRKKLVEWESLDARLALLETRNAQSVFVSRVDLFPTSSADLARRLADEVICIGTNPKNNEPIYVSAFEHWKGDARRHIFRRIEFTCKPRPADVFNLYKGLGVEPKEGDCSLILDHIKEVICSGDEDAYQSMLKLLAWQIQHIGEPSRIVVILKSEGNKPAKASFSKM